MLRRDASDGTIGGLHVTSDKCLRVCPVRRLPSCSPRVVVVTCYKVDGTCYIRQVFESLSGEAAAIVLSPCCLPAQRKEGAALPHLYASKDQAEQYR
eukprot:1847249-Pyramimonas_sp.AAC.1